MQTFISRNGEQLGSWTDEEVRQFYQAGQLVAGDHYWREGMAEWDLLGNLLGPASAPPPIPVPLANRTPPPVPAHLLPARDRRPSVLAWIIPLLLTLALVYLIGPLKPEANTAARAGVFTGEVIVFVLVAFPLSLLFPRGGRLAARCVISLALAGVLVIGKQQAARNQWIAEVKTFGQQQARDAQQQIAKNGKVAVDPQKIDEEIQKLRDMSQGENPQDRKMSDYVVSLMKEVAGRGQACRKAEQPMLTLGMNPSRFTSVDELDKRRTAVLSAQPVIESFIEYLKNLDTTAHASLVGSGVTPAAADGFVRGLDKSGKMAALLTYWRQEDVILSDLAAHLDMLKKDWGQWRTSGNNVVFADNTELAEYKANLQKLHGDIALQRAAQQKVLNTSSNPPSQ